MWYYMLMVKKVDNVSIKETKIKKTWFKRPLSIGLIVLGVLLLAAGATALYLQQSSHDSNKDGTVGGDTGQGDEKGFIYGDPTMSVEDRHTRDYVRRVDGEVLSVSDEQMQLRLSDSDAADTPTLDLAFTDNTTYSKLNAGVLAVKGDVVVGKNAVVGYDMSDDTLLTVWVDYDE